MQARASLFALSLLALSLAAACGDSADTADDAADDDGSSSSSGASGTTSSSSGGSTSSGSSGSTTSSSSSSSGSNTSSSSGSTIPEGCVPMTATGSFENGPTLRPRRYGAQPTFRSQEETPTGVPGRPDLLLIRIDAATGPGSYDLAPALGNDNCYEDNAQCVYVQEDLGVDGQALFVATRGRLRIDAQITADQSQGVLEYVELRESELAERNVPFNQSQVLPEGRCLWLENVPFDTRRPNGCDPYAANPCPAGKVCIRENAAGTDGTCQASTGGGTNGAPCSRDAAGDSNCGLEYMCSEEGGDTAARRCRRLCKLFEGGNVCPTNTICGAFGYCEPPTSIVDETVAIGQSCSPSKYFCGTDGARGICFNALDEQLNPLPGGPRCHEIEAARSACPSGQELGYVPLEGYQNIDRSFATCLPRNY